MDFSDPRSYMMAGEAAAQILSQKLEILLYHPVCLGCLLMEKLVKDAKEKLATIQEFFSTQDRPSKSTEWLRRLLRAMYDAEEFIDNFHLREARGRHEALHAATRPAVLLISKYKLWRDLSNLVNKMQELCQFLTGKGKTEKVPASSFSPASVPSQGRKKVMLPSFWYQQASNFLCHEIIKEEIIARIKMEWRRGKVNVTSILGEQGIGKTFLARWVYRNAMHQGIELRIWVRLWASMDMKELLFEILKQMGKLSSEVYMNLDLTEMLYKELAGKIFLIVLDDVLPSNVQLLQRLLRMILFHSHGNIIITAQDYRLVRDMIFFGETIKLAKLDDHESQKMLASKLHRVPNGQSLSKDKNVLNTCTGLPLSLSLLGGLLSYAKEHERAALMKDCSTLSDLVQLSYHRLPVYLKPCFIYLALFPVASPIPTRRLVRLWMAEGLLDSHCYNRERKLTRLPEDVGGTFIFELADRNLIDVVSWRPDGSPKACQMLTSLYDMIRPIAMCTGFLHIHDASESTDRNNRDRTSQQQQAQPRETQVRWLTEHTNIVRDGQGGSNPGLNLGHVHSFLSFYLRRGMLTKDISVFLRKMASKANYSLLRVLDLEGVYKPSLHGVLQKLVLLRYLGLRCTLLDSLPSAVADLHYLETLDIKHTNITSLPSSFWKAKNLRHLHLNWFYINLKTILKACSNDVKALAELQTLSGLVIGEVRENWLTGHIGSLTTLKLFLHQSNRDTSGAAGKAVADWITSELTNLQSLTFGMTKKAKPAKKAMKVAKPMEEAQPAAQPAKEANPEEEATKVAKPAEEAEPATPQIGSLPELPLAQHHELLELYLLGQLNNPIWTKLLPDSLRVLTLSGSKLKTDTILELGGLLRNLRTLRLLANSFLCTSLRFIKDGFPSLKLLKIWKLPRLEKVIIEEGAMLHLQELEFRHLDARTYVKGIDKCQELETIFVVIKKDARAFADQLLKLKRQETILYLEEDSEGSESMDSDEEDSY